MIEINKTIDKKIILFLHLIEAHPDHWKEKDITLQTGMNILAEDTSLRNKDNLLTKQEDGLLPHLECCLLQDLEYLHSQTDTGIDLHTDLHIDLHTDHLHTNQIGHLPKEEGDYRHRIHIGIHIGIERRKKNMREEDLDMEEDQGITNIEDNNSSKYTMI